MSGRTIQTILNKEADTINYIFVAALQDILISFSMGYINSLTPKEQPHHFIDLKPGVPLVLLRNLETSQGLCNGTQLIFMSVSDNGRILI